MAKKVLYYIRYGNYVGNSVMWWALNSNGYTCDLRKAQKYTKDEAITICKNRQGQDHAFLAEEVEKNIEYHICKLPNEIIFKELDN